VDAYNVGREGAKQMGQTMQRQCAWCLRLMNDDGEPISSRLLSKLYEATHGMCCECGEQWLEDVMRMSHDDLSERSGGGKMSAHDLLAQISLSVTHSLVVR